VEGYSFSTEILVRFAETDAQGIAHHASFVVWLEVARVAYLSEHAGGYLAIQAQGLEALTTAVEVRYHRAAHFDDRLRIWTRCVDIRGARFRYEYAVERDGVLIAEGATSHATVDATTRRPTRVPASFAEAVARAESASTESASARSPAEAEPA
jgi:acyl-CoA thioester hydrolase